MTTDDLPPVGAPLPCLLCGEVKLWGTLDSKSGVAVCVECRDAAWAHRVRFPTPASEQEQQLEIIRRRVRFGWDLPNSQIRILLDAYEKALGRSNYWHHLFQEQTRRFSEEDH